MLIRGNDIEKGFTEFVDKVLAPFANDPDKSLAIVVLIMAIGLKFAGFGPLLSVAAAVLIYVVYVLRDISGSLVENEMHKRETNLKELRVIERREARVLKHSERSSISKTAEKLNKTVKDDD